jgi:hypothetical protein
MRSLTIHKKSSMPFLLLIAQGLTLAGCAENVPKAQQSKDIVVAYHLDADDQTALVVDTAPGVVATNMEKDHFTRLLSERLDTRRMRNVADGNVRQCDVHVTVTKFERGNKFARVMLAGLGQMHLDANVLVTPAGGGDALNEFTISKTFAWGGVYGASEGIEDIEPPFADGIAAALTGQTAEPDKVAAAK